MPLTAFLSALLCLLTGVFVYVKGKNNPVNRYFLVFNILIFFWNSGDFVIPLMGPRISAGLIYDRLSQIGGILIAPWFILFYLTLTGLSFREIVRTKIFRVFVAVAVLLLFLAPTPLLIERIQVEPFKEFPGKLLYVEITAVLASIFFGLRHLFIARKTVNLAQRVRLTYFGVAVLMGILSAVAWFVIITFVPGLSTKFIYVFEVTYVLLTAYAILRHHLMNIDVIVKRTALYTILSTFVIGVYIAIILIFEVVFRSLTGYSSLAEKIIAAFIIALTFQPVRTLIEKTIDRIFARGKVDYQDALAKFTRSLGSVLDLRELVDLLVSISGILRAKNLAVMLRDEQRGRFKIVASTGLDSPLHKIGFDDFNDIVRVLNTTNKIITTDDIKRLRSENVYKNLPGEVSALRAEVILPIFVKGELDGILFLGEKRSEERYDRNDFSVLATLADEAGIAMENAKLYGSVKRTYFETVQALSLAIEANDEYTRGHSDRVTKIAVKIAKRIRLTRERIDTLKFAGILHDIGKIGVIKEVLHKPTKLSDLEFALIKNHPVVGEEIIKPVAFLDKIRPVIHHHHERFDGSGYPDGLRGKDIPFLSRIITVADAYDAMTSHRPYRSALSHETAVAEITKYAGTQFDPEIVQAFLEIAGTLI
ncbi:MAG TPA: HD domain-containing protein [Candidatus Aminicenantes bacterium]|nr:HD domain-containing protein [Candidatus Aminicenantes bacterium]